MKPEIWDPYYVKILDYFGFSREADEQSAKILSGLLPHDDLLLLINAIEGADIIVAGNSPSLAKDITKTDFTGSCIIAADAAARKLNTAGIRPDVIFSDLDGLDDDFLAMNEKGTILVIHAHGDNIPLVKSWLPKVKGPVIGTTQSTPLDNVYNFGGFSDGDRAVFAAHELGGRTVKLIGFDLDDRSVDPVKHGKLMIARNLLHLLGHDI
ncbi:MAG: DUF115 domain-containing protein [Methanocorpusculum sp.]|nr:DUF115 domain-containing protein [Methanocorpusculum sp.]